MYKFCLFIIIIFLFFGYTKPIIKHEPIKYKISQGNKIDNYTAFRYCGKINNETFIIRIVSLRGSSGEYNLYYNVNSKIININSIMYDVIDVNYIKYYSLIL